MKISLLDNGLDSLRKGYERLKDYEEHFYLHKKKKTERFFILKDAIVFIHHGIEILLKYILFSRSEYLIYSKIDDIVKTAYEEKRNKKLNSVFETSQRNKIHTITYEESISRVIKVCGFEMKDNLSKKLKTLQDYRNQITHAEIYLDENEVNNLFKDFLDELDSFLFKTIGNKYKTLSGYSELLSNYEIYKEFLQKNNRSEHKEILEYFISIFEKLHISMGLNEVKLITDIDIASKIFDEIASRGFRLGTDLYNGFCSGNVSKVKRIGKRQFSLYTKDNDSEYVFSFKGLLIVLPSLESKLSPLFYFESDEENNLPNEASANDVNVDTYGAKVLEGINFEDTKETVYESIKLNEFYSRMEYDEYFVVPPHHEIYHFLTGKIFCYINFQSLGHVGLPMQKIRDYTLKQLEVALRRNFSGK